VGMGGGGVGLKGILGKKIGEVCLEQWEVEGVDTWGLIKIKVGKIKTLPLFLKKPKGL